MQLRDKKGRFIAIDPEIKAIASVLQTTKPLGLKAKKRVVQYLYGSVTKTAKQLFPWEEVAGED